MAKKKKKSWAKEMPAEELVSEVPDVHCGFSEMIPLEDIKPNPGNPNVHPQDQVEMLAAILRASGWREAIVVSLRSGYVVKGHGRLQSAQHLKLKEAPVEFQDYVDEQAELADMIADNRIAQHSYVDALGLGKLLKKMSANKVDKLGYTQEEISLISAAEYVAPKKTDRTFVVLETLKMTKESKAIVSRAVQKYCLRIKKEIEWGDALASICIEWETGAKIAVSAESAPPEQEPVQNEKPVRKKKDPKKAPLPPPMLGTVDERHKITIQYVASTNLNDKPVTVIRQMKSEVRFYTNDEKIRIAAQALKGEKCIAEAKNDAGILWLTSIKGA